MFETAVINVRGRNAEQRAGLFALSVAVHTAVGVALILAGIQSLQFPTNAPNQMVKLMVAETPKVPPALDNPEAKRAKQQAASRAQQPRTVAPANAAPQTIPDRVTPVAASSDIADPNIPIGNSDTPGSKIGVIGGFDLQTNPEPPKQEQQQVFTTAQVDTLPIAIKRVSPEFPAVAQRLHLSGWVLVEGVIDTTGRIHEPRVVASSFAAFEKPALDAVQQWEFKPGVRHGAPVDTLFQLKVTFTLR